MNLIGSLTDELATAGLRLRKAQVRDPGRLTMELHGPDGLCAGQWHESPVDTLRTAAHLCDTFGNASVQLLAGGHLLVQHAGADRMLPRLHGLVARPGATLVAHRPERRAVVRVDPARYVKVVRPGRTAAVVGPLARDGLEGIRVPRVLDVDPAAGLVTLSALPGQTLLERLGDRGRPDHELALEVKQVGAAVRILHDHGRDVAKPSAVYAGAEETEAAARWLEATERFGLLDPARWRGRLEAVGALLSPGPPELVLLHRDLHDKQVLLDGVGPVGLIDLDLAAYGDPALDLANLLVHLDLRALQGVCSDERARACSSAYLEGYSPDPAVLGRLGSHAAVTRLRLAGVYSFRPSPPGLVDHLLEHHDEVPPAWR